MNPYSVSAIGVWPNERYLYKIEPSIIDYRYGVLPMTVFSSPQLSEDNNFAVIDYNKPDFNSNLIGISSNAGYIYTDSDGFFKSLLTPNLTFSWTPSALRTGNYGNMLNAILLNTSDWRYFTVVSYPSELFLYPVEISKINNLAIYQTDLISISAYTISELLSAYTNIQTISSGLTSTQLQTPLISSISYAISSLNSLETTVDDVWYSAVSSGQVTTNFKFISSITTDFFGQSLSTFSYVTLEDTLCSYYINIDDYVVDYNNITTLENYVSSITFLDKITALDYKTFFEITTSTNYALQTSSVLLKPYDFQFLSRNEYATTIKTKHNDYLSRNPETLPLNNDNLKTISYTLSGALVNCNKSLINFTETNNPIYGNFILEDENANIRPETVKLAYKIHYANMNSTREPKEITSLGDLYDDMFLDSDRSIESSYIVSKNNNKLTFQLLQSALNLILPLEHPTNCVLSAILDLDKCTLEYVNQRFPTFNAIYNDFTPISGFPGTDLSIRYIADSPVDNQKKLLQTTVLNISSNYGNFSLNSAVSCKSDNHVINWTLEYPPYYYSFKNTFVDKNNRTYSNVNSLGFYLSSEVFFNEVIKPNPNDFTEDYARIDLYTSVYSDFDIIELPLSEYSINDYIKYELVYRDQTLFLNNLSAFLVLQEDRSEVLSFSSTLIPNSNFVPYDIINSPYVPAVSGVFLRLIYNLDNGGAVFSVKPSLSTKIGAFDAFWGTTFSSGITYKPRNFVKNPPLDTITRTITSATFSVETLTGIDVFGPDLRNTNVRWNYKSSGSHPLKLINKSKGDIGIFTEIVPNSSYLFNVANVVELTGLSDETVDVTFYSEEYNVSSTRIILPELFDLYYENKVNVNFEPITLKEKIKILKCTIDVPFFDKKFNITGSERIKWNWIYDNITDPDLTPVTAYYLNNNGDLLDYDIDTVGLATLSTLYFYVDTNYSIIEELNPLSAFVEVYSLGEVYSGKNVFNINSYPDPTIFSTDFYVTYPNFPSYQLINTDNNIRSLTRPPNGTNIYNTIPFELKTRNVSISGMNWKIKKTVLDSFSNTLSTDEEELSLTPNASGFYDDIILNRDYNLYNITFKKHYNNEIFTSNSPLAFSSLPITNITDLLNLSSYLILPDLITNNVFVTNITATENISPLATSINFITTSYYITSFDIIDSIDIVKNLNNLYTYSFYTSTNFININNEPVEYIVFNVNYWLSANYVIKTDKQTEIDVFSSLYINPNLNNFLSYNSIINPTTTVEYDVTKKEIEKNLYAIYDISLNAESVGIPNWTNLYDFSKSAQIIIATDTEFIIKPKLILTPNFVWVPQWKSSNFSKLSNKFVTVLSGYNPSNIFGFLTGKTYGNRKDGFQEYNIVIQDVQDFKINKLQDPITILLGAGSTNEFIQDQIIDRPEEFSFIDNGGRTILIENFRIPIKPEIYSTDGMVVYLTAYNRFFPVTGGLQYYGLNSLTATELTLFNYPITARTLNKDIVWDNERPSESEIQNFLFDAIYHNPKLFEYEKTKFLFYPDIININLDTERLIQVKQILEIDPLESPNEIEIDKSTVTYELKSDYWSVSSVVPAVSNRYFDLFRLTVGDSTIPLTVSNFERSTLFLSATANIATKIPPTTFSRTTSSQYTGPVDLWNTVYQKVIGNEETTSEQYKILFSEVNSLSTSTGMVSTYNTLAINDNLILTT